MSLPSFEQFQNVITKHVENGGTIKCNNYGLYFVGETRKPYLRDNCGCALSIMVASQPDAKCTIDFLVGKSICSILDIAPNELDDFVAGFDNRLSTDGKGQITAARQLGEDVRKWCVNNLQPSQRYNF